MNKRIIYITSGSIFVFFLLSYWYRSGGIRDTDILVAVRKGDFEIVVTATGELEAKSSLKINAPDALREARIFQVKIADLIPEGTIVKENDYIASLDKSEIAEKLRISEMEIQKMRSLLSQNRLDTSLNLRLERDEVISRHFLVKEKETQLKNVKYETPVAIQQAEFDLKKAQESHQQAISVYKIRQQQAYGKMSDVAAMLLEEDYKQTTLMSLMENFTIRAPASGMVIYQREWNGQKKTVGSQVSAWDACVATLPDMSVLVARTYVSEVDISKVQLGQKVRVSIDALPDQKIEGKIVQIATIGEQRPHSEAKVFEVKIELLTANPKVQALLRPTMTTNCAIICEEMKNVTTVPLEALHSDLQGVVYVFVKDGRNILKKQVLVGKTNEIEAIILQGLSKEEEVFLSSPQNPNAKTFIPLPKSEKASN